MNKRSNAKKLYWANISPEERSRMAAHSAKLGWAKKSKKARMDRIRLMIKSKKLKKNDK